MVQASQKPVVWSIVIVGIILALMAIYTISIIPTAKEIGEEVPIVEVPTIVIPTAAEIAAEITIPTTEAPTETNPEASNSKLLEGIFDDEVDDLEAECIDELNDEFLADLEDDLRDLIEDELGDDVKDINVVDWNYRDNYELTVINLGLDDEDDKAAEMYVEFRVQFHEVFGDSDWHFEKVAVKSICSDYDSRDNEFDKLDVEYALI